MKDIRKVVDRSLKWTEGRAGLELYVGRDLVAQLYDRGDACVGETMSGTFMFRQSAFGRKVTIEDCFSESSDPKLRENWRGELTLECQSGRKYQWREKWRREGSLFWTGFVNEGGEPLVHFARFSLSSGEVELEQPATAIPDVALLILLGLHLLALGPRDEIVNHWEP